MATISLANNLKTLFCMLGCVMIATLIYTISVDGLPFGKELLTPWMAATLVDFYINVVPLAVWPLSLTELMKKHTEGLLVSSNA